jgi:hypothetical protein
VISGHNVMLQGLLWETSLLDAEEGIRFRGYSIPELQVPTPTALTPHAGMCLAYAKHTCHSAHGSTTVNGRLFSCRAGRAAALGRPLCGAPIRAWVISTRSHTSTDL